MNKFFILGCPRSGTTVLQQALNRHSRIVIPPETRIFSSFVGHSRYHQLRHIERLNRDLQIRLPAPPRRIRTKEDVRVFFERMTCLYLERLGRTDISHFGEKSPAQTGRIWRIKQVFPEAKILFLYRDGRDVALSLTKVPWMYNDIYVNFTIWLYYCWILQQAQRAFQQDLLCVRYEDLVTAPTGAFRKILDFLGLDYETAVVEGHGNSEGIAECELSWKARAMERITAERIGVWRQELSEKEIAILEQLGRNTLESLGYPLTIGECVRPSPGFYANLCWNFVRLISSLSWGSLANEILERLRQLSSSPLRPRRFHKSIIEDFAIGADSISFPHGRILDDPNVL